MTYISDIHWRNTTPSSYLRSESKFQRQKWQSWKHNQSLTQLLISLFLQEWNGGNNTIVLQRSCLYIFLQYEWFLTLLKTVLQFSIMWETSEDSQFPNISYSFQEIWFLEKLLHIDATFFEAISSFSRLQEEIWGFKDRIANAWNVMSLLHTYKYIIVAVGKQMAKAILLRFTVHVLLFLFHIPVFWHYWKT